MKKTLLFLSLIVTSFASGLEYRPSLMTEQKIAIENRVLLKINGKAITLMDIVRKMDLLFYRQYPEMSSSDVARFQFYSNSWEPILQMVIDEELMLADAEEKKIPITDGEIRQEMEGLFGPQVVLTLDKLHLTFEEAFELIRRELIVQKVTSAFVRSRAVSDVTPAAIRLAYQKMIEGPVPEDSYVYQYITVRGENDTLCKEVAEAIYQEAKEEKTDVKSIVARKNKYSSCTVTLSDSFERKVEDISLVHLRAIKHLQSGDVSEPLLQKSRTDRPYYRLFVLQEFRKGEHPALSEVEVQLKQKLLQEAYALHNEKYRAKLREYYDISNEYLASFIPAECKPFALR